MIGSDITVLLSYYLCTLSSLCEFGGASQVATSSVAIGWPVDTVVPYLSLACMAEMSKSALTHRVRTRFLALLCSCGLDF